MSDTIRVKYVFGDIVYLKVRSERQPGMVTGIHCRPSGATYLITWNAGNETSHYDFELTDTFEPDFSS